MTNSSKVTFYDTYVIYEQKYSCNGCMLLFQSIKTNFSGNSISASHKGEAWWEARL